MQTHTHGHALLDFSPILITPPVDTEGTFLNLIPRLFCQKVPDQKSCLNLNYESASLQNHIRMDVRTKLSSLEILKAPLCG